MKHLRAKLLQTLAAGLAAAALTISPVQGQDPVAHWGLLANPGFDRQPMKTVFFFAGSAGYQGNYTIYPASYQHLIWSDKQEHRDFAVGSMFGVGANAITMSTWGEPGTDRWRFWAPMQTSPQSHDEVFETSARGADPFRRTIGWNILIMPTIESSDSTLGVGGTSAGYHFRDDFPGTPADPAPQLVKQIVYLVNHFLKYPANRAWPGRWARMYNQSGQPRYAIHLMHVASSQYQATAPWDPIRVYTNDAEFALGFDRVAARVKQLTGYDVGFVLDTLPINSGY